MQLSHLNFYIFASGVSSAATEHIFLIELIKIHSLSGCIRPINQLANHDETSVFVDCPKMRFDSLRAINNGIRK